MYGKYTSFEPLPLGGSTLDLRRRERWLDLRWMPARTYCSISIRWSWYSIESCFPSPYTSFFEAYLFNSAIGSQAMSLCLAPTISSLVFGSVAVSRNLEALEVFDLISKSACFICCSKWVIPALEGWALDLDSLRDPILLLPPSLSSGSVLEEV